MKILSESQLEQLVLSLADGQGKFTEKQAQRLIEWAEQTLIDHTLLEGIFGGEFVPSVKGKQILFKAKT